MKAPAEDVKKLREMTGAGFMNCKSALEECNGNMDEAVKVLRKKGAATAAKKSSRSAAEGAIGSYLHFNKRIGVMVEINCETDFVARNEKFVAFAHEIAMHIAAYNPRWTSIDEVPADILATEREVYAGQLQKENKPANILEKIVEGKLAKFYEQNCLLNQKYSADESITVDQALKDLIQATGENCRIGRFIRYSVGEEQADSAGGGEQA